MIVIHPIVKILYIVKLSNAALIKIPLLKYLYLSSRLLMLSEIEITHWAVLIDKLNVAFLSLNQVENVIRAAAIQTKFDLRP